MFIVIVGGGKVGSHLAEILLAEGHKISVIEKKSDLCDRITQELKEVMVLRGDGCDPHILKEAGVSKADIVAAVTGHDEDNLVVCQLSKFEFKVGRVIARVNNPKNEWLFTKEMGVDIPVSNTHIVAKIIEEEMTVGEIVTLLKLRKGEVALVEQTLSEKSKVAGKEIKDISLPEECVMVAVMRGKQIIIPKGSTPLLAGDGVLALTSVASEKKLAEILGG